MHKHPSTKMARWLALVAWLILLVAISGRSSFYVTMDYDRLSWSRDSRRLCFRAGLQSCEAWGENFSLDSIMTIGVDDPGGPSIRTAPAKWNAAIGLANRGDRFVYDGIFGLWTVGLEDGATWEVISNDPVQPSFHAEQIAWSPDDRKIAYLLYHYYFGTVLVVKGMDGDGRSSKAPDPYDPEGWERAPQENTAKDAVGFAWISERHLVYASGRIEGAEIIETDYWKLDTKTMVRTRINQATYSASCKAAERGRTWRTLDYAVRAKLGLPEDVEPILFGGDRKIIFADLGSVYIVDADGKNRRRLVIGQAKKPVRAPNGRDVMFAVPV